MSGLGILVGPGVVGAGAVPALRDLAQRARSGVVNTWGAKGVMRWDDPHHHGTAGLQAHDFALAGLGDVEVLLTSGLDPAEVTSAPWAGRARVVDVAPAALTDVDVTALPPGSVARPALYERLAAVVQPRYREPASPAARAAALARSLPPGGLVVAEPGLVGFWVARTLPTEVPGSVVVPATRDPAGAWAVAARAAAAGRAATLVTDGRHGRPKLGAGVRVERWDDVDLDPSELVAVAGPIVAWGGIG